MPRYSFLKNAHLFQTVFAIVGWALAIVLALYSNGQKALTSPPTAMASSASKMGTPNPQLDAVLDAARGHLGDRRPQDALGQLALAFSLCRAQNQEPPAEVYQLFMECLCQSVVPQAQAASASSSMPRVRVASVRRPVISAPPTPAQPSEAETTTAPAPPSVPTPACARQAVRPNFSLPQADYPTAPSWTRRRPHAGPSEQHRPESPPEFPPAGPPDYQPYPSPFPGPPTGPQSGPPDGPPDGPPNGQPGMRPPGFPGQFPPNQGDGRRPPRSRSYPGEAPPAFPPPITSQSPPGY